MYTQKNIAHNNYIQTIRKQIFFIFICKLLKYETKTKSMRMTKTYTKQKNITIQIYIKRKA